MKKKLIKWFWLPYTIITIIGYYYSFTMAPQKPSIFYALGMAILITLTAIPIIIPILIWWDKKKRLLEDQRFERQLEEYHHIQGLEHERQQRALKILANYFSDYTLEDQELVLNYFHNSIVDAMIEFHRKELEQIKHN